MNVAKDGAVALLDFAYPERCVLCGAGPSEVAWTPRGRVVRGLRWWDRTQLCCRCLTDIRGAGPLARPAGEGRPPVWAATATGKSLVKVVGLWKYHGLRGLAWPISGLMADCLAGWDCRPVLVPVPLHPRRRWQRGFNQADAVADLVAGLKGWPLGRGLLRRRRPTTQQARITDDDRRRRNLAGAFEARPPGRGEGDRPLLLVDDLVTSGATALAAKMALRAAGWPVSGVLAFGLAKRDRPGAGPVDTGEGGF